MRAAIRLTDEELDQVLNMCAYVLESPCMEYVETIEELGKLALCEQALTKLRAMACAREARGKRR